MSKDNLITRARQPGRSYDVYQVPDAPHSFSDGVIGFAVGTAVTRIEFFRTRGIRQDASAPGGFVEERERNQTIILPTAAFAEFLGNALKGLQSGKTQILDALEKQMDALRKL